MLGLGKTATVRDSVGVSPARSQKIYRHYAVALYRQALLDRGDPARAGHVGMHPDQRLAGIHPRGMAGLLRVVLRRLTTPPPAAEDGDQV